MSSIVGGSGNSISRCHSVTISTQNHIGGGTQNFIDGGYGNVIAGGSANYISGSCSYSSILGGTGQKLYAAPCSIIVAGRNNCIVNSTAGYNSIVGGYENELNSSNCSLVVGGLRNCVAGNLSSIVGGRQNEIQEDCSFIGGGYNNQIDGCMDFIGAGQNNCTINTLTGYSNVGRNIIVGGCGNIIDGTRGWNFIGGGYDNAITSSTTIGDHNYANSILGRDNLIDTNTDRNSISGGGNNTIVGENVGNASIAGGVSNCITGATSHIGGGSGNIVSGIHSTIAGGAGNTVSAASSSIMGGHYNTASHTNSHIIGSNITSDKTNYTFVNNLDVEGDAIIGDTLDVGGVVSVDSKINITQLTLTDAATVSWNLANGSNSKITLGGNRTLAISNVAVGDTGTILVQQGSGTTHTLTLPAGSLVIGGATYTTTTTSNGVDVLGFYYDGTNYFWSIPQTATTGAKGDKGEIGTQGADGEKGQKGQEGVGTQGATGGDGEKGQKGELGVKGDNGEKGQKGEVGADSTVAGPQGTIGTKGDNGPAGSAGAKGDLGPQGTIGTTGTQGTDGDKGAEGSGGGSGNVYNTQTRYLVNSDGDNYQLYATATSNMYVGSWARVSTTLTITYAAHGLAIGDKVVIRNTNQDYLVANVSAVTTDTFSVTCVDTGATSGAEAVYGTLFTAAVTQNAGDVTAVVLSAPGGLNGASQLNALSLYANNQESGLAVTLPAGFQEGAGGYTDKQDINIASADAKAFSGTGQSGALSPTLTYNLGANFNRIDVSGIDNFSPVNISLRF